MYLTKTKDFAKPELKRFVIRSTVILKIREREERGMREKKLKLKKGKKRKDHFSAVISN